MTAFDHLAGLRRWVAWKLTANRGREPTKVPFGHGGGDAKANDPSTWLTRAEAEAVRQTYGMDGTGIQLGDLGDGTHLIGIDLDSCIGELGTITDWAQNILDLLRSYAETSPSGTGIKLFFRINSGDVRPLLREIGVPDHQYGCKRTINADGLKHGPAIELYASHRYFTVTDQCLAGHPEQITLIDRETLSHLAGAIPRHKNTATSRTAWTTARASMPPTADTTVDTIVVSKKLADARRKSAKLRRRYRAAPRGWPTHHVQAVT